MVSLSELAYLKGEIRDLTKGYMAGTPRSAGEFRQLVALLLTRTIVPPGEAPRLTSSTSTPNLWVLGGQRGSTQPLPLTNGAFLKCTIQLVLVPYEEGGFRLKVRDSSYQYQLDEDGDEWIFRYDYERDAADRHPSAHLHVNGSLAHPAALLDADFEPDKIHYPTARVSIESVIRCLVEQYGVPVHDGTSDAWRELLAESEQMFHEIAHQPASGPGSTLSDQVNR